MELGLSLGDASKPFGMLAKAREISTAANNGVTFCMALGINSSNIGKQQPPKPQDDDDDDEEDDTSEEAIIKPVQLDLLPLSSVPRHTPPHQQTLPWSSDNGSSEGGSSGNVPAARGFDVNRLPPAAEEISSPNSVASSFGMDFFMYKGGNIRGNKRDAEAAGNDVVEGERASSRASDDDENGLSRKKLRLSKEQSAYLEESFKEHTTLNPKQKLALAKQLNLRPRQVEVWFQNRRARTKLKQTEVDCEYLKRCCETLTEENRRLHKELQELRALKTSNPFYMQLPATTLTMCPSCERVATTSTAPPTTTKSIDPTSKTTPFPLSRPRLFSLSHTPSHPHHSPPQ